VNIANVTEKMLGTDSGRRVFRFLGRVFGRCPSVSVFGCCALPRWHVGKHGCTMGSCHMGPVFWTTPHEALRSICSCGRCGQEAA
jgi:hypothetical protein